jgi:RHS repeat-associated protein
MSSLPISPKQGSDRETARGSGCSESALCCYQTDVKFRLRCSRSEATRRCKRTAGLLPSKREGGFAYPDVENRLVGISYPGQSGKQTAFTYDGLSRRTAITSTPAGGSATVTSYGWCGSSICQARNASNSPIRSYYAEGEFVPGGTAQRYYYGPDQIGSVRRTFVSTSNAPAYGYDPYGNALQATASLTDFGYAGTFYNADSGLYLTQYRAYDPVVGRWLSRDPIGESSDPAANLYTYVLGNPISYTDPRGLDVTVRVYPGQDGNPGGHIGIQVNSNPNVGFDPARNASTISTILGRDVPGSMDTINSSRRPEDSVTIYTTPQQDEAIQDYLDARSKIPGSYNTYGNNCAKTVSDALRAGDINAPDTMWPRDVLRQLQRIANP